MGVKKLHTAMRIKLSEAPLEDQNLKTIIDLRKFKVMSGLSDHTENNISAQHLLLWGGP